MLSPTRCENRSVVWALTWTPRDCFGQLSKVAGLSAVFATTLATESQCSLEAALAICAAIFGNRKACRPGSQQGRYQPARSVGAVGANGADGSVGIVGADTGDLSFGTARAVWSTAPSTRPPSDPPTLTHPFRGIGRPGLVGNLAVLVRSYPDRKPRLLDRYEGASRSEICRGEEVRGSYTLSDAILGPKALRRKGD